MRYQAFDRAFPKFSGQLNRSNQPVYDWYRVRRLADGKLGCPGLYPIVFGMRSIQGLGGSGMPYSQTSFDGVLADFLGLYSITSTHPVMFVFRFR